MALSFGCRAGGRIRRAGRAALLLVLAVGAAGAEPYVEATGGQLVNTGYHVTPKTRVVADFAFTGTESRQYVFGCTGDQALGFYMSGDGFYSWHAQDGSANGASLGVTATTDRRRIALDGYARYIVLQDRAEALATAEITAARTKTASCPLALFALAQDAGATPGQAADFAKLRLYSFALYEEAELKMFLKPVKTADGTGALLDLVSGQTFASSTGTPLLASEDCPTAAEAAQPGAGGVWAPQVGADGLSPADVALPGDFAPQGVNAGPVRFSGTNTIAGDVYLAANPTVVSPRVYRPGGFSKNLARQTDDSVQVTYAFDGGAGLTTVGGGFADFLYSQRGDILLLDGNIDLRGNLVPTGHDGGVVVRGRVAAASADWSGRRGHNSTLFVDAGAELTVHGVLGQNENPYRAFVDGVLNVEGTIRFNHNYETSFAGLFKREGTAGRVNAEAIVATRGNTTQISVPYLNLGAGGLQGVKTTVGATELGAWRTDAFTVLGTPTFNGTTFRTTTASGDPAVITLAGAPVLTGAAPLAVTGSGALVLDVLDASACVAGFDVKAGATLAFAQTFAPTSRVAVAAGATLKVRAGRTVTLPAVALADGARLVVEASPGGVGRFVLPAGALADRRITLVVDGAATPPAAGVAAPVLAFEGLAEADLAAVDFEVAGDLKGTLAVRDGALVFTVTESATAVPPTLAWSGAASRAWDVASLNWLDAQGGVATFAPLADAFFGTAAGEVAVDAAGVAAGAVTVDSGDWTFTGGRIGGAGVFTVTNGATVSLAAPLDEQEIVVAAGILRPDATATNSPALFGSRAAYITVKDGGTFDLNAQGSTEDILHMTHGKRLRIEGEGATRADGVRLGAVNNLGPSGSDKARLHTIELTGDATIMASNRWDVRPLSSLAALAGRPQVRGPGRTLTVAALPGTSGSYCAFVSTDLDVARLRLAGNVTFGYEGDTTWTNGEGVEIDGSRLQFWSQKTPFTHAISAISAMGANPRLGTGYGRTPVTGRVTVGEGVRLDLTGVIGGKELSSTVYRGGFGGAGDVCVASGLHEFACDFAQTNLAVAGGWALYGDQTAGCEAKAFPRTVTLAGGAFGFAPGTNAVFSGYTVRTEEGRTGVFLPSRTGAGAQVATIEDTRLEGALSINLGLGSENPKVYARQVGHAVFGKGFEALALGDIRLGTHYESPADATLTVADGARIVQTNGARTILGYWSGTTNNLHRIVVAGGELDASEADVPYVGYDARAAEFLVDAGTVRLPGVVLRARTDHNMAPIAVGRTENVQGYSYEVFGMRGGTVELAGDFTTARTYAHLPQIWLGGGTLMCLADWKTSPYQAATFEAWGDLNATNAVFTLDTNGKTVTFRSPLQGTAPVRLVGTGRFVADDGVQGGVSGPWRVENTGGADLRNAAAFAGGLALADGVAATIDIGPRTNYTSLAVSTKPNDKDTQGNNTFQAHSFWNDARVFPSLFTKDIQKLLLLGTTPHYTAYRNDGAFYVPEAAVYTFGAAYDDRAYVALDGAADAVAFNTAWNKVGTGRKELAAGWHAFRVTGIDYGGGAGPQVADWKTAKMAVGFHVGVTDSTAAADYTPFSSRHLRMRPSSTVRWSTRYVGTANERDWAADGRYAFGMVTNSMQAIHDRAWSLGYNRQNIFTGWTYVEPQEAGTWKISGIYDDSIAVYLDGRCIFKNSSWNTPKEEKAEIAPGWHSFRVVVRDYGGGISWNGGAGHGCALKVKRPSDADWVVFDERAFPMTADPYGFIGGTLALGAGATLTNASDTPCEIAGMLAGEGSLVGPFRLTGTWRVEISGGRTLRAVQWGEGADAAALAEGRLHVVLDAKPLRAKYMLGPALGLEALGQTARDAKVTAELAGADYVDGFSLVVEDGQAVLVNRRPSSTVFLLR